MMYSHTKRFRQQGLTLIEVMIAMVLSLILLLGITQIFTSTRVTYRLQEGLSRLQENGRFAINFLREDIRQAGYIGCADDTPIVNVLNNATTTDWDYTRTLQGFQATGANSWSDTLPTGIDPVDGTDAILIRYAEPTGLFLNTDMPDTSAVLQTISVKPPPVTNGDILTVTDCSYTTIFQNTSGGSGTATQIAHNDGTGTPGNSTKELPWQYGAGAEVLKMTSVIYYIDQNAAGTNSLYRRADDGAPQELVRGIENMQLQFGVDTNTDGSVDNYITADAVTDWNAVMSIRAALLVNSIDAALDPNETDTQTYALLGTTVDPADTQQLRHVFTTTASIRNRVLVDGMSR